MISARSAKALNLQVKTQLVDELLRKVWPTASVIVGYQFSHFVLTHHDSEPLFPVSHHAKLPFVGCTGNIRQVDMDRLAILRLAAKAIDATGSLFNLAGVPS